MVDLAGKKIVFLFENGKTCQCVVEFGSNGLNFLRIRKKHARPPAFQVRRTDNQKVIAYFNERIAKKLSAGKALNMRLA